jgi:hypothetical protein
LCWWSIAGQISSGLWTSNAVLFGRWRAFALGHRLCIGDHLVFRFKLGTLEASVRIFAAADVCRTYPQPAAV